MINLTDHQQSHEQIKAETRESVSQSARKWTNKYQEIEISQIKQKIPAGKMR